MNPRLKSVVDTQVNGMCSSECSVYYKMNKQMVVYAKFSMAMKIISVSINGKIDNKSFLYVYICICIYIGKSLHSLDYF